MNAKRFDLGDVSLQSGETLESAHLIYQTWGELSPAKDNVILLPTFYTGTHVRNEGYFGAGRAIDPARHFVVSINLFGNGLSSSPSNGAGHSAGSGFPLVSFHDNVRCQHRLLTELFGIEQLLLVTGWSMAACQSFQWGAQYPEMVRNILPFCGSARTSPHNIVFLEGVKAALQADGDFNGGNYSEPPVRGLKAFGRVYAGWAFSQTFYREKLHREIGFETAEDLLVDWEQDHLDWDANDLLAMLATWQAGDISLGEMYSGDFEAALKAIQARTIVLVCDNDLYFPPADNEIEMRSIRNGELRVIESPWGHVVASPSNPTGFQELYDQAVRDLIGH